MSNLQLARGGQTAALVKKQLDKNREAIVRSLPVGFNFDRMCRAAVNAVSTTPALAECTPSSLFLGVVKAFALGLEPNGALGEGYLVPFRNKGVAEAQFMPSYRGLVQLARRSGEIATIYAREVCEHDEFELEEGLERRMVHKPKVFGDRGKVIGYYAVYRTRDGEAAYEVMSRADIEKIRASSKAKNSGPWVDWYDEMAKKTVIKRLMKLAPMSIELATAVAQDNGAATGEAAAADIIDIDGLEVDDTPAPQAPSSFEGTGKASPSDAADQSVSLAQLLANAPVTVEDIAAFLQDAGEPFDELAIRNNLRGYISRTLDWREAQ